MPSSAPSGNTATTSYDAHWASGEIEHVYALRPLYDEVVQALDPVISMVELVKDIAEIGYPM